MNILEHYIEKIYSKKNITEEYRKKVNNSITEKYYVVDIKYDCYGSVSRDKKIMSESEYNDMIEKGYFMAQKEDEFMDTNNILEFSNIKSQYNHTDVVLKNIEILSTDIFKNINLTEEDKNYICNEIILATGALERIKTILNDNLNDSID